MRREGMSQFTDVLAEIPKNARVDKDYEEWRHLCYCLWKREKCDWGEAVSKMETCRDSKEHIAIRVPVVDGKAFYSPQDIVRYL